MRADRGATDRVLDALGQLGTKRRVNAEGGIKGGSMSFRLVVEHENERFEQYSGDADTVASAAARAIQEADGELWVVAWYRGAGPHKLLREVVDFWMNTEGDYSLKTETTTKITRPHKKDIGRVAEAIKTARKRKVPSAQ